MKLIVSYVQKVVFLRAALVLTMVVAINPVLADDACKSLTAIELAAPVPELKCRDKKEDLYKRSVSDSVFTANEFGSSVDDKVAAVQSGLTEEHLQESYLEVVSEDSTVHGRVKLQNKSNNIVNYSLDPTGRAEQSIGAIR